MPKLAPVSSTAVYARTYLFAQKTGRAGAHPYRDALLFPVDRVVEDFNIFLDNVGIQMLVLQAQVTRLETALGLQIGSSQA
jgi:hypothetical protein